MPTQTCLSPIRLAHLPLPNKHMLRLRRHNPPIPLPLPSIRIPPGLPTTSQPLTLDRTSQILDPREPLTLRRLGPPNLLLRGLRMHRIPHKHILARHGWRADRDPGTRDASRIGTLVCGSLCGA